MHRPWAFVLIALCSLDVLGGAMAVAESDQERAELAKAMGAAKVSIESGLSAATATGNPISAKFEVEDGKLQLSVYTEKTGKFREVVVDHMTGKVAKSEPITGGEDLVQAKSQTAAMTKAKLTLSAAVSKVLSANAGYHAVSVLPSVKEGHPVAEVALLKGADWRTVMEKLD